MRRESVDVVWTSYGLQGGKHGRTQAPVRVVAHAAELVGPEVVDGGQPAGLQREVALSEDVDEAVKDRVKDSRPGERFLMMCIDTRLSTQR